MNKNACLILLLVIGGFLLLGSIGLLFTTAPTGYSGLTASVHKIVNNDDGGYDWTNTVGGSTGSTQPIRALGSFDADSPTGLRIEIDATPSVVSQREDWSDTVNETISTDTTGNETVSTVKTRTWEAHIVKLQMSATVRTDGGGWMTVDDVIFSIRLQENSYSVFQFANESAAYILEVYTLDKASVSDTSLVDISPAAGGFTFQLTTIDTDDPPQWLIESGYTGNLRYFKDVAFDLTVVEMAPMLTGWLRNEVQATWTIGIDVLLFGYWEVTSEYHKWIEPDITEFPDLTAFFQALLDAIITFVWLIVGLIATIVIFWKIRNLPVALVIVGIVWLIVLWQLGYLEGLLAGFGI